MTAPGGAYAAFRPELHPRDSHGRFRDKWGLPAAAKKLVDGIVNIFKPMTGGSDQDLEAKLGVHAGKQKRTPKQKAALDRFTSNGFAPVQADLRAKKPNADAAEMQSMLQPLPEDMLLTRVVGPEAFGLNPQRIGEVEEWTGKLVADKGFAPTNVGTPFQVGAPHVTMSIMTPKGTPAIIPGGSREVILGPDQPLRIVKVDSDGRGGVYVYAVAQPSGRTRALGRGIRPSEKAPAIEATPDELAKRGLQEPSPDVSGVQPAPGATPSASAPESTPQAPDVNAPEAAAPDAKVADREAKVAEREAKVAEREAQVAELRGAKKAGVGPEGKKARAPRKKAEPGAVKKVPAKKAGNLAEDINARFPAKKAAAPKKAAPKAATPAAATPEAPKRGRHAAPSAPSAPKLSTKEQALEDRRKQRQVARDRQQQIAHANGIAVALAEVTELERKIADPKVMADHVRAIAKGPHVEEIRDVDKRNALIKELNEAADALEAGNVTNGRDLIDDLARKNDVDLIDNSTGFVDFNPDEHEALGGTIPAGAKVKIVRPGAMLHRGGQVQLFKAKVVPLPARFAKKAALPKRPAAARPEDIPELRDLRDMNIDQVRDMARAHKMNTEDVFGRIPKADLVAMLDGRRIAAERVKELDPNRKWKRAELEAMKVAELQDLAKAHGLRALGGAKKHELVSMLQGRPVNEPYMRNETPSGAGGLLNLDIKELAALADRHDVGVGFNPSRAEIIRRLLAKGINSPDLEPSKKNVDGLRQQVGDMGLVVPPNATREELLSIIENPPKIQYHQTVPARLKKLIDSVASGIKRLNPISGGAMGDTSKAELEDGGEAIRKSHKFVFGQNPRRQADAEQLASVLAEAVGAPTPAVYRQDGKTIFMGFVVGKQAAMANWEQRAKAFESPDAKRLGLLDAMVGNGDRHDGNWMITPAGKPVGIDHGLAWSINFNRKSNPEVRRNSSGEIQPGAVRGNFVDYFVESAGRDKEGRPVFTWRDKIEFSRKELEEARERFLAQRPQFELLGRGAWFDVSLERLDAIIKRATLP